MVAPAAPDPPPYYGDGPEPGHRERPLQGYTDAPTRLKLATLAVGLASAAGAVGAISGVLAYFEARRVADDVPGAGAAPVDALPIHQAHLDALNDALQRNDAWIAVWALALIVSGVCVLLWQVRANRNLPELGFRWASFGPVSTVFCWLVPVWQWFAPKAAINELWRSGLDDGEDPDGTAEPPAWLAVWWGVWLLVVLGGRIAYAALPSETLDDFAVLSLVGAAMALGLAVAGVLMIRIMWRITDRQRRRAGLDGLLPT